MGKVQGQGVDFVDRCMII